jgi:hypothetical protein
LPIHYTVHTFHLWTSTSSYCWRETSTENIPDMKMRWKPRYASGSKHRALYFFSARIKHVEKYWNKQLNHYNYWLIGHNPSSSFFFIKNKVSETGFCLRPQVKAYSVGPNRKS